MTKNILKEYDYDYIEKEGRIKYGLVCDHKIKEIPTQRDKHNLIRKKKNHNGSWLF